MSLVIRTLHALFVPAAILALSGRTAAQLDENCVVTVNGRAVRAEPDGSFQVFVPVTNDAVRALVVCQRNGQPPLYTVSPSFLVPDSQTITVGMFPPLSPTPPLTVASITAAADVAVLTGAGQTTQLRVLARMSDGSLLELNTLSAGTTYRTSSPGVVSVSLDGVLTAEGQGGAYVTARNNGATAVARVDVVPAGVATTVEGFTRAEDGTPVADAEVTTLPFGGATTSDAFGFFSLPLVVPSGASLQASATADVAGTTLAGASAITPIVPDGITDVGIVVLRPVLTGPRYPHGQFSVGPAPSLPRDIALGDVDGDGFTDLVASGQFGPGTGAPGISVLRNTGAEYAPPATYGARAQDLALADLDNDGDLDVAYSTITGSNLAVALNDGSGAFGAPLNRTAGSTPLGVAAADLSGDGWNDVVVASSGTDQVRVFLGTGGGALAAGVAYATGDFPFDVALGDLDADFDLDIVVSNDNGQSVSVLSNQGAGTFAAAVHHALGADGRKLALGDLDGDGDLDVAVARFEANFPALSGAAVLSNDGLGNLAPAAFYSTNTLAWGLSLGDLNGDLTPDLAITSEANGTAAVLVNDGNGVFFLLSPTGGYALSSRAYSTELDDFDLDGSLDLIAGNVTDGNVSVLLGDGFGGLDLGDVYAFGGTAVAVADLDGDDRPEVLQAASPSGLRVFRNLGNGTFSTPDVYSSALPQTIAADDLDGDGDSDVVLAIQGVSDVVAVMRNDGAGFLDPQVTFPAGPDPRGLALGDYDGDGDLDVATTNRFEISVLLNDGLGNLGPRMAFPISIASSSVAAGDLDGDGDLDLAGGSFGPTSVWVVLGDGTGAFGPSALYAAGSAPLSVDLGDFDGDGDLDLASANNSSDNASILLNAGNGTFVTGSTLAVGVDPIEARVVDADVDGLADVLILCSSTRNVFLLRNQGAASFAFPELYGVGLTPSWLAVGDLEGNGRPDLVVTLAAQLLVLHARGAPLALFPTSWTNSKWRRVR
jgi:hypothetical protein